MSINVKVNRNFNVNGKVYHSIEEMPDDIRENFLKAMEENTGIKIRFGDSKTRTKISFNGNEYDSIDEMPDEERQIYEKVLQTAKTGKPLKEADIAGIIGEVKKEPSPFDPASRTDFDKPDKIEPSIFSPRFILGVIVLALAALLVYFVIHGK